MWCSIMMKDAWKTLRITKQILSYHKKRCSAQKGFRTAGKYEKGKHRTMISSRHFETGILCFRLYVIGLHIGFKYCKANISVQKVNNQVLLYLPVLFNFLLSFPHLFFALASMVPHIHCSFILLLTLKGIDRSPLWPVKLLKLAASCM